MAIKWRAFSQETENLARAWRDQTVTDWEWNPRSDLGILSGETNPFWVGHGDTVGLAKPGIRRQHIHRVPRAAHEKIAADLAYDLNLPVPPVVLWDRGVVLSGEERFVSIAAVPFPDPVVLEDVDLESEEAKRSFKEMSGVASAMSVFDTWVQNTDHKYPSENVLVDVRTKPGSITRVAYIDYAFSLSYAWRATNYEKPTCVPVYHPEIPPDYDALNATIVNIETVPDMDIRDIIVRIPPFFLTRRLLDLTLEGLLHRQTRLREILSSIYPDLQ
jgi:hypothetical protein